MAQPQAWKLDRGRWDEAGPLKNSWSTLDSTWGGQSRPGGGRPGQRPGHLLKRTHSSLSRGKLQQQQAPGARRVRWLGRLRGNPRLCPPTLSRAWPFPRAGTSDLELVQEPEGASQLLCSSPGDKAGWTEKKNTRGVFLLHGRGPWPLT